MTEHPGEQFPPDVDPDVEPDYAPERGEEPQAQPDYDSEPGAQNDQYDENGQYGAEPARVDPAEVEFGPEFAREPDEQHEQPFEAESAQDESPQDESGHPLVEEVMARLDDLREKPVGEHAEVYADLHERLQTALVEADSDQGDSR
ncbi:hypothetical protein ACIA49_35820 [Kribbella sp. NPDC051587]|uniref:hypothetical protein n=1 Tax=Kribbella sp. NPDC051587 TaxID=3364119 RepID=UPI0037BDD644